MRRVVRNTSLFVLSCSLNVMAQVGGEGGDESAVLDPADRLADAQTAASVAYRARKFEEAARLYEEALALTPEDASEARMVLSFNLGSCAFEQGLFAQAQQRFDEASRLAASTDNAELAVEAKLHAGLAALRGGDAEGARARRDAAAAAPLAAAPAGEPPAGEPPAAAVAADQPPAGEPPAGVALLFQQLEDELEAEQKQRVEARMIAAWKAGDAALASREWAVAKKEYARALAFDELLSDREKAYLHRGLAVVAAQEGDTEAEQHHLTVAYGLDPDPRDLIERGDAKAWEGDAAGADADYAQALRAQLAPERASDATAKRSNLRPLPEAGTTGWLSAGVGYDTNAAQSGAADTIGVSVVEGDGASPYLSAFGAFSHTFRHGLDWATTPSYVLQFIALTDDEVQDQSLQQHQLAVQWTRALGFRSRVGFQAGATVSLVGLEQMRGFAFGGLFRGELRHDGMASESGAFTGYESALTLRPLLGLDGFGYMDGLVFDAKASVERRSRTMTAGLAASLQYYGIGAIDYSITADQLVNCGLQGDGTQPNSVCSQLENEPGSYHVPLGYLAPALTGEFEWLPHRDWRLSAEAGVAYRYYLEESYAVLDGERPELQDLARGTRKRRLDWRPRFGLGVLHYLDRAGRYGVALDYSLLVSASNMNRDESTVTPDGQLPTVNLDYGDRSFVQQLVELRLEAVF